MSRRGVLLWLLATTAGAALVLTGHGPHVVGYLPYLVLLACPLMHMFMHRDHHRDRAARHD